MHITATYCTAWQQILKDYLLYPIRSPFQITFVTIILPAFGNFVEYFVFYVDIVQSDSGLIVS